MIAMTTSSSMRVKAVIRRAALICLIPPLPAVEFIPGFDPESPGLRVGNALLEAGRVSVSIGVGLMLHRRQRKESLFLAAKIVVEQRDLRHQSTKLQAPN